MAMKSIGRIFYGMLGVSVILFVTTVFANMREITWAEIVKCNEYEETIEEDGKQYITIDNPAISGSSEEADIVFFTSHYYVHVYADGELIYTVDRDLGRLGHTPGNTWNFVRIPFGTKLVEVELQKVYHSMGHEDFTFYIGDELQIYKNLYSRALFLQVVGFAIVLLGLLMIGYGFILNRRSQKNPSMLPLGIFSVVLGLWSCNETNTMVLLYPFRTASSTMAYLLLLLMPIPFLMFTLKFLDIKDKYVWKLICIANAIVFAVTITLQLLGIRDLKESVLGSHVALIITVIYVVVYLIRQYFFGERTRKLKTYIWSMLVIIVSMMVEISLYYTGSGTDVGTFGRFGFLGFVILLGVESAEETNRMLDEARRIEVYKEMATKDWLTGLGSRNAFAMKEEKLINLANVGVFVFDLNNLKQCNDRFGHAAGDRYLRLAAECIHEVFKPYGDCFRIGGDEFCCLVTDWSACPVDEMIQKMREEEKNVNTISSLPVEIQIACGYAVYDGRLDINLKATRNRADEMMYRNKVEIKTED